MNSPRRTVHLTNALRSPRNSSDFASRVSTCVCPVSNCLEDRNLLKLRSLDSSCPFFLNDLEHLGTMNPNAMIARLKSPSGPPNAVIAKGRNRGKTPNAIVD